MKSRFKVLDHIADIAIEAKGATLEELFENAALGISSEMADLRRLTVSVKREISVEAQDQDLESLLVAWLSELLYHLEVEGEVYSEFKVKSLSPERLNVEVKGGRVEVPRRHIKAVTYHGLKVEKIDHGFRAVVVYDI